MRAFVAVIVLILAAPAARNGAAAAMRCGIPGRPPCALQALMRDRLAAPYAQRHFEDLAANLDRLVELNPNPRDWQRWNELALDAARAARAHDEERTLKVCTSCHRAYRRQYVEHYRERELPTLP